MYWIPTLICTAVLYWVYDGYGRFLRLAARVASLRTISCSNNVSISSGDTSEQALRFFETFTTPRVAVLLTVRDEETAIRGRLDNLLACEYPAGHPEIYVASDGSTDCTNEIVSSYASENVQLILSPGLGKTATQNLAMRHIDADIVVFTDADTEFDKYWLVHVVNRFADERVGAVDGRTLFGSDQENALQRSQGFYWNYEMKLRDLESRLGILAVVTGASFAVRRRLFREMDPAIGEDCIVPLDVISQGCLVVHEPLAVATYGIDGDDSVTFRRRVRMTLRNWQGTWTRPELLNPFRSPGYSFALWSHKLLRWLSPLVLAVAALSSSAGVVMDSSLLSVLTFLPFGILFALATIGWYFSGRRCPVPLTGTAYSFMLANAAFLTGVFRAVTGRRIYSYRNS